MVKIQIPSEIKIGGHIVKINLMNLNTDLKSYGGQSNIYKNTISLQLDMPQSQKESIILHEIIEHIDGQNDLQMNHTQISVLSNSLYQILVDYKV